MQVLPIICYKIDGRLDDLFIGSVEEIILVIVVNKTTLGLDVDVHMLNERSLKDAIVGPTTRKALFEGTLSCIEDVVPYVVSALVCSSLIVVAKGLDKAYCTEMPTLLANAKKEGH